MPFGGCLSADVCNVALKIDNASRFANCYILCGVCVAWIGDVLKDVLMDVLLCCIKTTNKKLTDNMKVLYKNNK